MKNFIDKYFNNEEYFFISFINHQDNRDVQNYLHNKESFLNFMKNFYSKIKNKVCILLLTHSKKIVNKK